MTDKPFTIIDLHEMDVVATEVAYRMITNRETWPGPMLAMKRVAAVESEYGGVTISPVAFGGLWQPEEPVVIVLRSGNGVAVYETVKDMLKDGWAVD